MGKILNISIQEIDDNIIEQDRLFNVYVFGLPRSGTSMMTKILELLGVNMIYTSEDEKEKTDERFKKRYGEYHANPDGFFEITNNQFQNFLKVLSKPYSGCKMIVPVNGYRWEIITTYPCKVIFMTRDPEEIRQSQMAYYAPQGVDVSYIKTALVTQRINLKKQKIPFAEVDYNYILKNPVEVIKEIKTFIRSNVDEQLAIDYVNPNKNRFKREMLIDGL